MEDSGEIRSELLYALSLPTKETLVRFLQDFRRETRRELQEQITVQAAGLAVLYYDIATLRPKHGSLAGGVGRTPIERAIADLEYRQGSVPRYKLQGVVFPGLPADPIYLRITPKAFTPLLITLGARPTRMALTGGLPETFLEISAPEMLPLLPDTILAFMPPLKRRARAAAGILETDAENIIIRLKPTLTIDDLFCFGRENPQKQRIPPFNNSQE